MMGKIYQTKIKEHNDDARRYYIFLFQAQMREFLGLMSQKNPMMFLYSSWPTSPWSVFTQHKRLRVLFIALFSFLLLALPSYGANQETILIVDGSGSMWGKFDKEHKIVTIRDLLPKQLMPYEGKGNLGIMSYGHRWKSNCRDIELIIPMSKVAADKHGLKLSKLSARGKTPITGSLQLAYSKFSPDAKIKQIILLSDGPENCRADPCAFMKELTEKDKSLTAHVITYGMGKNDAKKLRCISDLSKGTFASPQDRNALSAALKDLFSKTLERQWKTLVKVTPKPKVKPGLFLKAYLGKGSLQLKNKVKWLVYKDATDAKNNIAPLMVSEKETPVFLLESGTYFVQLLNEKMGAGKTIKVDKKAHQESVFRLNAGIISVDFAAKEDFLKTVNDFRISLVPVQGKKGNSPIPIAFTTKNKESFTVAAGTYKLITQLKNYRYEKAVILKAGEHKKEVIPLKAGLFSLEAVQSYDGTKLRNISYKIMRKVDGAQDRYFEYTRLASAAPNIVLPTGYYYVEAKSDLAVAIENFNINAGAHHRLSLNLNAGQIILNSKLVTGKIFNTGEVTYKITQSDLSAMESQKAFFETSLTNTSINLPVGSYAISSSIGKGGSYVEQSIVVEAGQSQTIDFTHKANFTHLSCIQKDGKKIRRNLFWKVTNETGQTVARSTLASLQLLLDEGQYTAEAFYQGQQYVTKFQVLATAKPKTVKIRVQ